jgi:hypothetical protein
MKRRVSTAFWIELSLASLTAFIAVLTAVWHDWVEGIFGLTLIATTGLSSGSWSGCVCS